jgi:hypothetical protein
MRYVCCLSLFLLAHEILKAQHFYLTPPADSISSVTFRYLRPFSRKGETMKGLAGTWEFSGRYSVGTRTQLFASFPYSYYSVKENEMTQGSPGNLTLGSLFAQKNGKTHIILGMIIPLASEDKYEAALTGISSDYYHFTKYAPDLFTFLINFSYHNHLNGKGIIGFELGSQFPVYFQTLEAEILINYGLQGGFQVGKLQLLSEITGLLIATERYLDLSERLKHNLILGMEYHFRICHPGIFYNFYLNKDDRSIRVLGFKTDFYISRI